MLPLKKLKRQKLPMRSTTGGKVLDVDMFLFAAGRSGNIKNLGCEKIGLGLGKRETILVDKTYRTNMHPYLRRRRCDWFSSTCQHQYGPGLSSSSLYVQNKRP